MTAIPINTSVTPNGTELAFFEKPRRAYTINGPFEHPWTPGEPYGRVPSVTGILGVLDKSGPLVGWATNVTCEAAWRMSVERSSDTITGPVAAGLRAEADVLASKKNPKVGVVNWLRKRATAIEADGYFMPSNWRQFQREMGLAGLSHQTITKEAQFRGSAVHKIGEDWVNEGAFPKLSDYPLPWQGYVKAIAAFLGSWEGEFEMAEQITGSPTYGYAGTCDTVAVVTSKSGTRARLDYKTSRQVYARSHFRQLEAYELAAVEGGETPTDRRGIVCLYSDGTFEIVYVPSEHMGPSAFLNTLAVWRDEQPLKKLEDEAYKARRARERMSKCS